MSGWDKQCQKVQRVTKQHVGFQKTCPNHCTVGIPLIFLFLQAIYNNQLLLTLRNGGK